MDSVVEEQNMTIILPTTVQPKGIDYAYMGKMMAFTFGAVLFILVLLLMDLYDRRCSEYVKEKLCGRRKKSTKLSTNENDVEDGQAVLNECKPGTSTSQC